MPRPAFRRRAENFASQTHLHRHTSACRLHPAVGTRKQLRLPFHSRIRREFQRQKETRTETVFSCHEYTGWQQIPQASRCISLHSTIRSDARLPVVRARIFPRKRKGKGRKGDSSGCKSKRCFGHRLPVPRIDGRYGLPLATAFFFGPLRFLFEDFPHDSIGLLLGFRLLRLRVFLLSFFRLSGRFGFIV